ncbi:MAG: GNAT family N-acetyltransferase [Planctomycetota bacterium]
MPLKDFLLPTATRRSQRAHRPQGRLIVATTLREFVKPLAQVVPDGAGRGRSAVRDFIRYTEQRGGRVVGTASIVAAGSNATKPLFVAAAVILPGETATILMSSDLPATASPRRDASDAVDAAVGLVRGTGVKLAQILLPSEALDLRSMLTTNNGFAHVADLGYLHKHVDRKPKPRPLPEGVTLVGYTEKTRPLFRQALEDSYQGSLDCTALNGVRSMDAVLDGHEASGVPIRDGWQVAVVKDEQGQNRPVGVMLLAGLGRDGRDGVELVYLGISPEFRGKSLSDAMLDRADVRAAGTRQRSLALAVDTTNEPGLRLYQRRQSVEIARRTAMFKVFS